MTRISISDARKQLAEIANQAKYQEKVTILTKHGEEVAAVAPLSALREQPESSKKKRATSTRPPTKKFLSGAQ